MVNEYREDVILALDIGTTNVKSAAITQRGVIVTLNSCPIEILSIEPGYREIEPDKLWQNVLTLLKKTCSDASKYQVVALGITTQRSTFTSWDKVTGKYLHNFITWGDERVAEMCSNWNGSHLIKCGRKVLGICGELFKSTHLKCASQFKVRASNMQMRLKWVMQNIQGASTLYAQKNLCVGTIDAWLIYKLTTGRTFATDYTNAAATGIFDMWSKKWCPYMNWIFDNPINALPPVRDCNANFGTVSSSLNLGFSVPILCVIGDQQASLIGNLLFEEGDMKVTMGTCLACDIITGRHSHPSVKPVFPQIAWKLKGQKVCYMAEAITHELQGKYLDWLVSLNMVDEIQNIDRIASTASFHGNAFFLKNDNDTHDDIYRHVFVEHGDSRELCDATIVKTVLESHVFKCKELLDQINSFYHAPSKIIIDGGASASNFIVKNLSTLTESQLFRPSFANGTLMGAFFIAGIGLGWWESFRDIEKSMVTFEKIQSNQTNEIPLKYDKWKLLSCQNFK